MRPTSLALCTGLAASVVLSVGNPRVASAAIEPRQPFYEGVVGASQPVGFADYQGFADLSLKAGFRAGQYQPFQVLDSYFAWELAVDWTGLSANVDDSLTSPTKTVTDWSATRLRALGGVRLARAWGERGTLFARADLGAEQVFGRVSGELISAPYNEEYASFGIVVEPGAGVVWTFGKVALGAQLALPLTVHLQEDEYIRYDPVSFDVDVLFTLSSKL